MGRKANMIATSALTSMTALGANAGLDYLESRPAAKELRSELHQHEVDAENHIDWLMEHRILTADEKRALKVGYTLGQLEHFTGRDAALLHPLQTRNAEQVKQAAEIRSRLLRRLHYRP